MSRLGFLVTAGLNQIGRALYFSPLRGIVPPPYSATQIATARESHTFWLSKGASDVHVAALLGNEDGEVSFLPLAVGDHGEAHAIFQWHRARLADIKQHAGLDLLAPDVTHSQMLEAAYAEMTAKWSKLYGHVWADLLATTTVEDGVRVLVVEEERSSKQDRDIARRTELGHFWGIYAKQEGWGALA